MRASALEDYAQDPTARAAEREADLRAVSAAAIAAREADPDGTHPWLSEHGVQLEGVDPRPWSSPARAPGVALDVEAWARDGFCVLEPVVDPGTLAELGAAAAALIEAAYASSGMSSMADWVSRVTQVPDPADWDPRLAILEQNPALIAAAAAALGAPSARCAWAHLVFKPPGETRPLPWHRDRPTWPLAEGTDGVAAWLSLDPLGAQSGGLRYAPGSHRAGASLADPVAPQVGAGEVILHHADVLHASGANRSGAWRRAWIGVFVAAPPLDRAPRSQL